MLTTIQVFTELRLLPLSAAMSAFRSPISFVLSNPGGCTLAERGAVLDAAPAVPVVASTLAAAMAPTSAMAAATRVLLARCCRIRLLMYLSYDSAFYSPKGVLLPEGPASGNGLRTLRSYALVRHTYPSIRMRSTSNGVCEARRRPHPKRAQHGAPGARPRRASSDRTDSTPRRSGRSRVLRATRRPSERRAPRSSGARSASA